jgi:uncharacterized membrane protein YphA (DoxX/SURF4 family)
MKSLVAFLLLAIRIVAGYRYLLVMLLYVVWKGAGAWSVDLRESE